MPSKTRVHELAKELGKSSKDIMTKLAEMGEFVKSPSSTIEAPAAQKIRSQFAGRLSASPPQNPTAAQYGSAASLFQARPPAGVPRPVRPRREWYRGPELGELTTLILDGVVIHQRSPFSSKPGGSIRYFADEVSDAQALIAKWANALFEGLTPQEIVIWMQVASEVNGEMAIKFHRCGLTPDIYSTWQAIPYRPTPDQILVLHKKGVRPDELLQHRDDRGGPSLALRLIRQQKTLDEVVAEVIRRRAA